MAKWEKEQSQLKMHLSPCPPSRVPCRAACEPGAVHPPGARCRMGPQLLQD